MKNRNLDKVATGVSPNGSAVVLAAGQTRSPVIVSGTVVAPINGGKLSAGRKPRRKRAPRDLSDGLPLYSTVGEFAVITHTDTRTITREIDDGELIATYVRGMARISRKDGLAYLRKRRKQRNKVGHSQRRRSPRKSVKSSRTSENPESP